MNIITQNIMQVFGSLMNWLKDGLVILMQAKETMFFQKKKPKMSC